MRVFCLILAAAGVSMAAPDPRELVRQAIANSERAWEASRQYSYVKRVVERRFDSQGRETSRQVEVFEITPSTERRIERDGKPVNSRPDKHDIAKDRRDRAFLKEAPDAFHFELTSEEKLPSGPAWVVRATPREGFRPRARRAGMLPKLRATVWIDKKDVQWVKVDVEAIDTVSIGLILARLAPGARITAEQTHVPGAGWVAGKVQVRGSARLLLVYNRHFERVTTYSGYRRAGAEPDDR